MRIYQSSWSIGRTVIFIGHLGSRKVSGTPNLLMKLLYTVPHHLHPTLNNLTKRRAFPSKITKLSNPSKTRQRTRVPDTQVKKGFDVPVSEITRLSSTRGNNSTMVCDHMPNAEKSDSKLSLDCEYRRLFKKLLRGFVWIGSLHCDTREQV